EQTVRGRRDVFAAIGHAVPISVPIERELLSEPMHLLECIAEAVVARERPFQQQSIVDLPKARVHLLVSVSAGWHMENLIELHNWNHTRPLPVVHFCPLLRIERLAHENV